MSFYTISDIHGCYNEFIALLDKINYDTEDDCLILLGDYIDRGEQSHEVIQWLIKNINNPRMVILRGNHEEEFIANCDILKKIKPNNNLLDLCIKLNKKSEYFDAYGTIRYLIQEYKYNFDDLINISNLFNRMPYFYKRNINGVRFIFVHAGFIKSVENMNYNSIKEFYLYSRDEAYKIGGFSNGTIICGHTPTILQGDFCYNKGHIFKYYNDNINCTYYNIDCGSYYRNEDSDSHLACLRLDDMKEFYI